MDVTRYRLLLLVVIALGVFHAVSLDFLLDDAFISFRYARNLVEGHGLVFNPGEAVEGYTNFLWVLILAAGMGVGAEPEWLSRGLGLLCFVASLLAVARFGRIRFPDRPWLSLLAPALLAANRSYATWATGGLETKLFSLLVFCGLGMLALAKAPSRRRVVFSSLLLAAAALTRPEGYLFFVVAALWVAWTARRQVLRFAGPFVLVAGAHLVFRWLYYGDIVPNTFHVKVAGVYWLSGAYQLWLFLREYLVLPELLLLAPLALHRTRHDLLLGAAAVAYVAYFVAVGGDHFEFRFLDVVLPLAAVLVVEGLARWDPPRWTIAAVAVLLLLKSVVPIVDPFERVVIRDLRFAGQTAQIDVGTRDIEAELTHRWTRIGKWLAEHAAPDESIAVRAAGAIPYYSHLETLDTLGLNHREIARQEVSKRGAVGHEKQASRETILSRGITYLIHHPHITEVPPDTTAPNVVIVRFPDWYWSFVVLDPEAKLKPGSYDAR